MNILLRIVKNHCEEHVVIVELNIINTDLKEEKQLTRTLRYIIVNLVGNNIYDYNMYMLGSMGSYGCSFIIFTEKIQS